MAQVDPFIQPIPSKWSSDSELRAYIEYLHRFLHDIWIRTGGANDAVDGTSVDLTALQSDVEENTTDIATNATNIAVNTADILTNSSAIDTNTASIAVNTSNISTNTSNIATNTANIAINSTRITSNDDDIASLQAAAYFVPVSTSVDYTASDFEFINAKGGATVTLPETPNQYSAIIVRNGDGSLIQLNGNGRMINSESTGKIYREGTSIVLQYFLDDDEWFVR